MSFKIFFKFVCFTFITIYSFDGVSRDKAMFSKPKKISKLSVASKLKDFGLNWTFDGDWAIVNETRQDQTKSIVLSNGVQNIELISISNVTPSQFQLRCDNEIKLAALTLKSAVTPYSGEVAKKTGCKLLNFPRPKDRLITPQEKNTRVVEIFYGETSRSGFVACESEAKYLSVMHLFYDAKNSSVKKIVIRRGSSAKTDQVFENLQTDLAAVVSMKFD